MQRVYQACNVTETEAESPLWRKWGAGALAIRGHAIRKTPARTANVWYPDCAVLRWSRPPVASGDGFRFWLFFGQAIGKTLRGNSVLDLIRAMAVAAAFSTCICTARASTPKGLHCANGSMIFARWRVRSHACSGRVATPCSDCVLRSWLHSLQPELTGAAVCWKKPVSPLFHT